MLYIAPKVTWSDIEGRQHCSHDPSPAQCAPAARHCSTFRARPDREYGVQALEPHRLLCTVARCAPRLQHCTDYFRSTERSACASDKQSRFISVFVVIVRDFQPKITTNAPLRATFRPISGSLSASACAVPTADVQLPLVDVQPDT